MHLVIYNLKKHSLQYEARSSFHSYSIRHNININILFLRLSNLHKNHNLMQLKSLTGSWEDKEFKFKTTQETSRPTVNSKPILQYSGLF